MLAQKQPFIQRVRNSSLVEWSCAEDVPGLKRDTEARDSFKTSGRGAMNQGRSQIERNGGLDSRENAGMSSERQARNLPVESLRFPGEGSSAQGQSGPKPRTEVVGDGQQVEIPAPP